MNPKKIEQEVIQIIAKLPYWIRAAVGIVSTVILAYSIFQKNFVVASLTLAAILWLVCLYIWMKRTEPIIEGGTEPPAFPKWRRFAMLGMILIPLIAVGGGVYWFIGVQTDFKADTIAVANFDGPNPEKYAVNQLFLEYLRDTVKQEKDIRVKALQETISTQEGPLTARELGNQNNADLLIWGWYAITSQQVKLYIHFELLSVFTENNISIDKQRRADVAQLENFELQTSLSQELTSISLFALGVIKYQEGDYEKANYYFSLINNKDDLPPTGKEILGYFQVTSFIFQNDNSSAISKFEEFTSQTFPEGFYLPELFVNGAIAYSNAGDMANAAHSYEIAGNQYEALDNLSNSITYYTLAIEQWRNLGSRDEEGDTLSNIGDVYLDHGRYHEALDAYQQALNIASEVGDRAWEGRTLSNIGVVYYNLGLYTEALDAYQQALNIASEVGDRAGEGMIATRIGPVYKIQGRITEALVAYQQALRIAREESDRQMEVQILYELGRIYADLDRIDIAMDYFHSSLAIAQEVGDKQSEAQILYEFGRIYADIGQIEIAIETLRSSLAIAQEVGDKEIEESIRSLFIELQVEP